MIFVFFVIFFLNSSIKFCLFSGSNTDTGSVIAQDYFGNLIFPSQSVMMREKIDVYMQYAQLLLGSADSFFSSPIRGTGSADRFLDLYLR